jgi:hypothetical protein
MISSLQYLPLVRTKNFLLQQYVENRLSPREIARSTFSCRQTVVRYLEEFEIELRPEDKSCLSTQTYGSKYVNGRVLMHKREAAATQKMLALREQGHSFEKIAQILNAMREPTRKRQGPWYAKTVRQVILRSQPPILKPVAKPSDQISV